MYRVGERRRYRLKLLQFFFLLQQQGHWRGPVSRPGLRRTNSSASEGKRSIYPSAKTIHDVKLAFFDIAVFSHALRKASQTPRRMFARQRKPSDQRSASLKFERAQRAPGGRRTAEKRDELAPRDAKCHLIPLIPAPRANDSVFLYAFDL